MICMSHIIAKNTHLVSIELNFKEYYNILYNCNRLVTLACYNVLESKKNKEKLSYRRIL